MIFAVLGRWWPIKTEFRGLRRFHDCYLLFFDRNPYEKPEKTSAILTESTRVQNIVAISIYN
jgi:hypothetical protein